MRTTLTTLLAGGALLVAVSAPLVVHPAFGGELDPNILPASLRAVLSATNRVLDQDAVA